MANARIRVFCCMKQVRGEDEEPVCRRRAEKGRRFQKIGNGTFRGSVNAFVQLKYDVNFSNLSDSEVICDGCCADVKSKSGMTYKRKASGPAAVPSPRRLRRSTPLMHQDDVEVEDMEVNENEAIGDSTPLSVAADQSLLVENYLSPSRPAPS